MLSRGTVVRTVGLREVQIKADTAALHLFETNWEMVKAMLEGTKASLEGSTPLGPGHFGYHLRDSYKIKQSNKGWSVHGALTGPPQGYWREFGTKGRSRGLARGLHLSVGELSKAYKQGSLGSGGEKAGMYAHKALSAFKRFIKAAYTSHASWWHL